jgi:hypothetical protein
MSSTPQPVPWRPLLRIAVGSIVIGLIVAIAMMNQRAQVLVLAEKVEKASNAARDMPASIEIDGTRIPPPPEIVPAQAQAASEKMQFTPTAGSATSTNSFADLNVGERKLEYGQTISGYPIVTGRRAVDAVDPAQVQDTATGYGVTNDPGGWRADGVQLNSRGLIENPADDPPSTRGASYSRAY